MIYSSKKFIRFEVIITFFANVDNTLSNIDKNLFLYITIILYGYFLANENAKLPQWSMTYIRSKLLSDLRFSVEKRHGHTAIFSLLPRTKNIRRAIRIYQEARLRSQKRSWLAIFCAWWAGCRPLAFTTVAFLLKSAKVTPQLYPTKFAPRLRLFYFMLRRLSFCGDPVFRYSARNYPIKFVI